MTRFGNLATRTQLRELGNWAERIRRELNDRTVHAIGRTWLAAPGVHPDAVRAVALRGRLTATSALATYGVWVSSPIGLWIANHPTASRLPATAESEHRLWRAERFPPTDEKKWRVSLADALLHYACVGREPDVIASIDSALNSGRLSETQLDDIFSASPRRVRRMRKKVRAAAQSGLETIMRLACEAEGWRVDIQIYIDGVGHVDVLIDGWLVIELDGSAWHDDDDSKDEDARRDAELILIGYRYQRFRHGQVMRDLPICMAVIRTILAGGRPAAQGA
jgi:very-short-patch-repair endonuclease